MDVIHVLLSMGRTCKKTRKACVRQSYGCLTYVRQPYVPAHDGVLACGRVRQVPPSVVRVEGGDCGELLSAVLALVVVRLQRDPNLFLVRLFVHVQLELVLRGHVHGLASA